MSFATFILTHGRADNVRTYATLRAHGYTGKIYLLIDNEDAQKDDYIKRYGDEVVIFDKDAAAEITDTCDNYKKRNSIVFARNYNFIVAKQLGIKYFWQLDDDYTNFSWRFDNNKKFKNKQIKNLDAILQACLDFFIDTGAASVAFAQGGDFIGGENGNFAKLWQQKNWFSRKAMNSFILDADKPVTFRGRVNDDVNLYVESGRRGDLFITIPRLCLQQVDTQKNKGGCTEIYLELGTYVKSFYSVIVAPSCIKVNVLNTAHKRIHHMVQWGNAIPIILSEKYRKL